MRFVINHFARLIVKKIQHKYVSLTKVLIVSAVSLFTPQEIQITTIV